MPSAGQPVTFRGLAAAAPASLDFLYRNPAIRQRTGQLRSQQTRPAQSQDAAPAWHGNMIAALAGQLAELGRRHREQVAGLQRALGAAHGGNLLLRRRLGQQPKAAARIRRRNILGGLIRECERAA